MNLSGPAEVRVSAEGTSGRGAVGGRRARDPPLVRGSRITPEKIFALWSDLG